MANSESRSRSRKKSEGGGGGSGIIIFLFVVLPASIFAAPTALLFIVGLIPTVVAAIIDRDPEKSAPLTVGPMNICGILPFTMEMWRHNHTLPTALHMLSDPLTWLVMYGAAAVGWIFYYMIPPMVTGFEVVRWQGRVETLRGKKIALIEEWGPEVTLDDEALIQQQQQAAAAMAQGARR